MQTVKRISKIIVFCECDDNSGAALIFDNKNYDQDESSICFEKEEVTRDYGHIKEREVVKHRCSIQCCSIQLDLTKYNLTIIE